jgi:hypothetical protein
MEAMILGGLILVANALGYWQGYRAAKEEQRFKDDVDFTMKLAMEVGRQEARNTAPAAPETE